jgi:hypothetical protein
VVDAADQTGGTEHCQRELVSRDLVLGDVVEEQGNTACRDERGRRVGRDCDLAVSTLRFEASLDDSELAFCVGPICGLAQRDVHADALIVAGIVELDPNADERLVCALLEACLRLDPEPVPHVRCGEGHRLCVAASRCLKRSSSAAYEDVVQGGA